jgi:hypothetical protein
MDDFADDFDSMAPSQSTIYTKQSSTAAPRSSSFRVADQSSTSHRATAASGTTAARTAAASLPNKSNQSTTRSALTVDGVQFHGSDMKGIYLRSNPDSPSNSNSNNTSAGANGEADQNKQYVDFQIILNEEEFRELERRKQTYVRQERNNNATGMQR